MPPWFSQISFFQSKESKLDTSRFVQLATIGIDNTPRVRTVVFRGWTDSYEMELYTDKRSHKFYELDLNTHLEICWYFQSSKCQFRFRGKSKIELGEDRLRHWEQLSEKSKLMWNWPYPGDKFEYNRKQYLQTKKINYPSDNFTLIKIDITHVEQLLLVNPVHIRRNWKLKNDWIEERINP
tara:strand:- start:11 stop:553 length:543 start_codon:yes stop_codon:yes gene_type:complete